MIKKTLYELIYNILCKLKSCLKSDKIFIKLLTNFLYQEIEAIKYKNKSIELNNAFFSKFICMVLSEMNKFKKEDDKKFINDFSSLLCKAFKTIKY